MTKVISGGGQAPGQLGFMSRRGVNYCEELSSRCYGQILSCVQQADRSNRQRRKIFSSASGTDYRVPFLHLPLLQLLREQHVR